MKIKEKTNFLQASACSQNYPNPFNPSTIISYRVPREAAVTLKVFDVLGREVTTLVDEYKGIGSYEVKFDASELTGGVYIYRMQSEAFIESRKMLLIK